MFRKLNFHNRKNNVHFLESFSHLLLLTPLSVTNPNLFNKINFLILLIITVKEVSQLNKTSWLYKQLKFNFLCSRPCGLGKFLPHPGNHTTRLKWKIYRHHTKIGNSLRISFSINIILDVHTFIDKLRKF